MKLKNLIPIIAVAALLQTTLYNSQSSLDHTISEINKFNIWSAQENKIYSTQSEKLYRLNVFVNNLRKIDAHNNSSAEWEMRINEYADMTHEEFMTKYTSQNIPVKKGNETKYHPKYVHGEELPENIDWNEKGAVTPVKQQGACGQCWAFSNVGGIEGYNYIKNGSLKQYSEQQLMDCTRDYGNLSCRGGLMRPTYKYIKEHGIQLSKDYPYKGRDSKTCHQDTTKETLFIPGHIEVPKNDNDAQKIAVSKQPISVAVDASILQFYFKGIIGKLCRRNLNHGVTAIGYGVYKGKKYWKVKNSWGKRWGEKGFFRVLRYEGVKPCPCGISMQSSYPTL